MKDTGVTATAEDISACHRTGAFNLREGGHNLKRHVLCRFVSRVKRTAVIKSKKKLKDHGEKYKKVYIQEDLTKLRSKLFHISRNQPGVRSATTHDGKTVCWLENTPRPVTVDSPDDLFRLGVTNVNYVELGLGDYIYHPPSSHE